MRTALVIAGRILRQRLRDRSAIVFAVLTPLGMALAFAAVIPDFSQDFHTTIAVVDGDRGTLSHVLVDDVLGHLVTAGIVDVKVVGDEATARADVNAERAGAAIIVPAGFTTAIGAGDPTEVRILGGSGPVAQEIARATVTRFANAVGAAQLTVATIGATGGTVDPATLAAIQAMVAAEGPIAVTDAAAAKVQASLATFYGAAMAIMFVFFATQYGALGLLTERRIGTLNRLLAAPIRPASIILGGAIAGLALGLIAMTVLAIATTLIVHANWGPPPLVGLLIAAAVIAAMGISTVIATLARTVEQAGGLNAIVALSLAAIGGVFIPLSQAPELLTRVSSITPHAWFLRAIDALSSPTVALVDILPSIVVLVAMGVVTGAIGLARARRALVAA
jgi:ABC-2 type transport system permease protein